MFEVRASERLNSLPPYLFADLDRKKAEVAARGLDLIDLGVGDPDMPTPDHIIQALKETVHDPMNHKYPAYTGSMEFTRAAAAWFERRFGVTLDPGTEILPLIGSKEGIAHLPLTFMNPGDMGLAPSPAYPAYNIGIRLAGGQTWFMDLKIENNFLPDLEAIPDEVASRAKLMFLNYPNNPTSAVADADFFRQVVEFAQQHHIMVCHDAAYSELAFDGYRPMSFLEIPGAKEVGIEMHSLSKTYNMTGWRIGFAAGRADIIRDLGRMKSNLDSGVFRAVQLAGKTALETSDNFLEDLNAEYTRRRDLMAAGLKKMGFSFVEPKASFYLWIKTPDKYDSARFCEHLLTSKGVVVTPGNGFGDAGEGYFRIALTLGGDRLEEALRRIESAGF